MFKGVTECIELHKNGVEPDTDFWYVYNAEKVDEGFEFDVNGDILRQVAYLEEATDVDVDKTNYLYQEFTTRICPAYRAR